MATKQFARSVRSRDFLVKSLAEWKNGIVNYPLGHPSMPASESAAIGLAAGSEKETGTPQKFESFTKTGADPDVLLGIAKNPPVETHLTSKTAMTKATDLIAKSVFDEAVASSDFAKAHFVSSFYDVGLKGEALKEAITEKLEEPVAKEAPAPALTPSYSKTSWPEATAWRDPTLPSRFQERHAKLVQEKRVRVDQARGLKSTSDVLLSVMQEEYVNLVLKPWVKEAVAEMTTAWCDDLVLHNVKSRSGARYTPPSEDKYLSDVERFFRLQITGSTLPFSKALYKFDFLSYNYVMDEAFSTWVERRTDLEEAEARRKGLASAEGAFSQLYTNQRLLRSIKARIQEIEKEDPTVLTIEERAMIASYNFAVEDSIRWKAAEVALARDTEWEEQQEYEPIKEEIAMAKAEADREARLAEHFRGARVGKNHAPVEFV